MDLLCSKHSARVLGFGGGTCAKVTKIETVGEEYVSGFSVLRGKKRCRCAVGVIPEDENEAASVVARSRMV